MEGFDISGAQQTPEVIVDQNIGDNIEIPIFDSSTSNIKGLSEEELNDVNKIRITINDSSAPVVVLFGPASCGKTMTLVRLSRYLQGQGLFFSLTEILGLRTTKITRTYAMILSIS